MHLKGLCPWTHLPQRPVGKLAMEGGPELLREKLSRWCLSAGLRGSRVVRHPRASRAGAVFVLAFCFSPADTFSLSFVTFCFFNASLCSCLSPFFSLLSFIIPSLLGGGGTISTLSLSLTPVNGEWMGTTFALSLGCTPKCQCLSERKVYLYLVPRFYPWCPGLCGCGPGDAPGSAGCVAGRRALVGAMERVVGRLPPAGRCTDHRWKHTRRLLGKRPACWPAASAGRAGFLGAAHVWGRGLPSGNRHCGRHLGTSPCGATAELYLWEGVYILAWSRGRGGGWRMEVSGSQPCTYDWSSRVISVLEI